MEPYYSPVPTESADERTVLIPRPGTRVVLLVTVALLALAAYWFFSPITLTGKTGAQFGCGSAFSPPTDAFPKNVCGDLPKVARFRAILTAAAAVLVGGVGTAMFGFERRTQTRDAGRREAEGGPAAR